MKAELLGLDDIKLPDTRQRRDDSSAHIESLARSIEENGLIHAITIDRTGTLVAGWCRYHAVQQLGKAYDYGSARIPAFVIPVVYTHKVSERELALIELEENIRRKGLSPADKAREISRLHGIRKEENPTQTVKDTAKDLAELRGKPLASSTEEREIADSLLIAQFSEDPAVQSAKTRTEAVRIVRRKLENSLMATIGSLEGTEKKVRRQEVLCADATVELLTFPADTFDVLIFDPPYGIGADTFGEQTSVEGHEYGDEEETALDLTGRIIAAADGPVKPTASVFVFCDIRRWRAIEGILSEAGWTVWQTPLIWDKGALGHCPRPGFGPKRAYESIVYGFRGEFRTLRTGSDVIRHTAVQQKHHAAEKPVGLIEELLSWVAMSGASVLDPTCGSGSTLLAARNLNMNAVGIELSEKFADIAKGRLAEAGDKAIDAPEIPLGQLIGGL